MEKPVDHTAGTAQGDGASTAVLATSPLMEDATAPLLSYAGRSPLWQPNLIVFISSACTMVLELVAGRIIAPYVGVSLYTWTSVIGVVLAGISLGNYLGGRLADRRASLRLLGAVFMAGALSSLGILAIDSIGSRMPGSWPVVVQILFLTGVLFFVPSTVLGGISPIVAKLAVRDLRRTGSTVGKIYASGAAGSIVGTFATGFLLIAWFGTHAIVWGVAVVLFSLGLLFVLSGRVLRRTGKYLALLAGFAVITGGSALAAGQGWLRSTCTRETNYFCIKVHSEIRDGDEVMVLVLDRLVHSYASLHDPTKLVYDYERLYAEATAYQAQQHQPPTALFVGGGGYTFPRYMESVYPGSTLHVVEIDPGVTQIAYDMLGLRPDSGIVSYNQDGRLFLEQEPVISYDLIFGDAFNDYSVPYHLTTVEFNERVRAWLAPDGLYLVNVIDGPRRDFLRSYTYTLQHTFQHVYVAPAIRLWRQSPRSTYVVIASQVPLDMDALQSVDAGDGEALLAGQVLSNEQLDEVMAAGRNIVLTDRYAPVDQMLAPVFRNEPARDSGATSQRTPTSAPGGKSSGSGLTPR